MHKVKSMNIIDRDIECENGDGIFTVELEDDEYRVVVNAGIKMLLVCGITGKDVDTFLSEAVRHFNESIEEVDKLIEESEENGKESS